MTEEVPVAPTFTHRLTTRIHSSTALILAIADGDASELADRGALLMRFGLIDNMTIARINGANPDASEQLSVWLNMAVMQFQQLPMST